LRIAGKVFGLTDAEAGKVRRLAPTGTSVRTVHGGFT